MNDFDIGREIQRLTQRLEQIESQLEFQQSSSTLAAADLVEIPDFDLSGIDMELDDEQVISIGEKSLRLKIEKRVTYMWFPYGVARSGRPFAVKFPYVPGTAPVAGCVSEWNPNSKQPFIGAARVDLLGVQREDGHAVVTGVHHYSSSIHCACGYIAVHGPGPIISA